MKSANEILKENKLKITPQRIAVLESIIQINNHPTAENIIVFLHENFPNISVGTVYKTLEMFVTKGIVKKVYTEKDYMRYEISIENHHHLYSSISNRIEDYFDEELDKLINNYFKNKQIRNFKIEDVKLQIIGKFTENTET